MQFYIAFSKYLFPNLPVLYCLQLHSSSNTFTPSQLVCSLCSVCASPLALQLHRFTLPVALMHSVCLKMFLQPILNMHLLGQQTTWARTAAVKCSVGKNKIMFSFQLQSLYEPFCLTMFPSVPAGHVHRFQVLSWRYKQGAAAAVKVHVK